MIEIQEKLSERALELLALPDEESCYILDIGYVVIFVETNFLPKVMHSVL